MINRYTLGDFFPPLESRLRGIISPLYIERCRKLADTLPGALSAFWGFEVPLGQAERTADFLLCCTQEEGHSRILADRNSQFRIRPDLQHLPAWTKTRNFCQVWEDVDRELYGQLLNTWLEFDISRSEPPYEPSLFFGTPPPERASPEIRREIIFSALRVLEPFIITPKFGEMLDRVLAPRDQSWVFQVGMMLARPTKAIRLCFRDLAIPQGATALLEDLEWIGDLKSLEALLEELSLHCASIDIDIDLGEAVGPKIGIECSFDRNQKTPFYTEQFCQWLMQRNIIDQEYALSLCSYTGLVHQDADRDVWPEELLKLAAISGPDVANYIACWVHHIKVTVEPDLPLSAKAYLAALTDRLPRSIFRGTLAVPSQS